MSKDKKYTYRVKQGRVWGPYKQYGPGSTIELTVEEAEGFLDTLELVKGKDTPKEMLTDETPNEAAHLDTMTVAQLQNLPEWDEVEPPRPTLKSKIVAAILEVRQGNAGDKNEDDENEDDE